MAGAIFGMMGMILGSIGALLGSLSLGLGMFHSLSNFISNTMRFCIK